MVALMDSISYILTSLQTQVFVILYRNITDISGHQYSVN